MKKRLRIAWLPDGKRLHLQDEPIDLIIQAFGRPGDIARAYDAAIIRVRGLMDELRSELDLIRKAAPQLLKGAVARRMNEAVLPFCMTNFITPLAAVAGAVADEVLATMLDAAQLERAFVNNGGDIALHLTHGHSFMTGMLDRPDHPRLTGKAVIEADSTTRGIATSGWGRRSHSLGIADAVTVLAVSAAAADAAATIIANATDLPGHPAISRAPANTIDADSDLGNIPVTTAVGNLTKTEKAEALASGMAVAERLLAVGLINGAALLVKAEMATICADDQAH